MLVVAVLVVTPLGDRLSERLITVDPLAKADFIVVLGGGHERAVEAARLYRDGWAPKVVVSSAGHWADDLADIVNAYGVPRSDILIDRQATRTHDHPRTVAQLPGIDPKSQRFIVVTSGYHTRRAANCFRQAGYSQLILRSPDWENGGRFAGERKWPDRFRDIPAVSRELLANLYYSLRGWT